MSCVEALRGATPERGRASEDAWTAPAAPRMPQDVFERSRKVSRYSPIPPSPRLEVERCPDSAQLRVCLPDRGRASFGVPCTYELASCSVAERSTAGAATHRMNIRPTHRARSIVAGTAGKRPKIVASHPNHRRSATPGEDGNKCKISAGEYPMNWNRRGVPYSPRVSEG